MAFNARRFDRQQEALAASCMPKLAETSSQQPEPVVPPAAKPKPRDSYIVAVLAAAYGQNR